MIKFKFYLYFMMNYWYLYVSLNFLIRRLIAFKLIYKYENNKNKLIKNLKL